jgi:hypothetical protein
MSSVLRIGELASAVGATADAARYYEAVEGFVNQYVMVQLERRW